MGTIPAPPAAIASAVIPDVAELSEDQTCKIELDQEIQQSETEALTDYQQHFAVPGVDPTPLDPNPFDVNPFDLDQAQPESQPLSTAASIPDLLEAPLPGLRLPDLEPRRQNETLLSSQLPEIASGWQPHEAIASTAMDLPQFDEAISSQTVPLQALPPEAVPEAVPHEAVPHEAARAIPPEVVPSPSQPASEPPQSLLHSELDMPLANIVPVHLATEAPPVRAEVAPAQVEVPPVQAEVPQVEVPLAHVEPPPEPEPAPVPVHSAPMHAEPAAIELPAPAEAEPLEPAQLQPELQTAEITSPPGLSSRLYEAERIHAAVELVFDRFRPLLVAAIVRELARHD